MPSQCSPLPPPRARQLTRKRGAPGANKNLKLEDLLVKQGTWVTSSSHVGDHWWEIKCYDKNKPEEYNGDIL